MNIISFNVPYPPDYGGVIDVFNKIRWLAASGVKIHLHSFVYNRPAHKELEKYCERVHYYQRDTRLASHFSMLPYIVYSRKNSELLKTLLTNNAPILFEGLHTCYYLNHPLLEKRLKLVRTHNIEHNYYRGLAKAGGSVKSMLFHTIESLKLRRFEKRLRSANHIFAISKAEHDYFKAKYGHTTLLPPFHPFEEVLSEPGRGMYILLHGNLSVEENIQAIGYLLPIIHSAGDYPIVIAGKNPDRTISKWAAAYPGTQLIQSPGETEMHDLIRNAQLIILYTRQSTGSKLKLSESLYLGRHVLANSLLVKGSGLEKLCTIADTPNGLKEKIKLLMNLPFDEKALAARKKLLSGFSNKRNAEMLIRIIQSSL